MDSLSIDEETSQFLDSFLKWKGRFTWPYTDKGSKWLDDAAIMLKDGVQPGDQELFIGESYSDSDQFSTGLSLYMYFRDNPQAAARHKLRMNLISALLD